MKHSGAGDPDSAAGTARTGAGAADAAARVKTLDQLPLEQLREFLKGYRGIWWEHTPETRGFPAPPIQKPCPDGARRVELPRPEALDLGAMPLSAAIRRRRSRTAYSGESLTGDELSFLLWSTQGIADIVRNDQGRIAYHLRTVPSGGARHPFETYLLVNRIEGLRPGVYRFLPVEHQLVVLREEDEWPGPMVEGCYGQRFVGEAAVVFVWTAVPYRTEWAYGYVSHRMIAIEAGHVCQNLYLACEAIGAGACAVLGYDQATLDRLVGVDGEEEFVIYLAAVGRVRED